MPNNYTLGRGKVHFSRFKPGTQIPVGYRYIGNTPAFSLTIDSDTLDHYSSDEGIKEKDDSVPLQVNRTGSFTTDNVSAENIAMFFYGDAQRLVQAPIASAEYPIADIIRGLSYPIGVSADHPTGLRGLDTDGLVVKKGSTALVDKTDYTIDVETGLLTILSTSATLSDGDDIAVTTAIVASQQDIVLSGSTPVEGALMYIANNPKGANYDYIMPYVKITPNGDYALKGDDWQTIPFNIEALKPQSGGEAIYVNGRPFIGA